jgi:DNA-binding response OmpR family regulator
MLIAHKENKKLLVIEDDLGIVEVMKFLLQEQGFATTALLQNADPMDLIKEHRPDLLITDLRLSGVDGVDVIQELRSQEETKNMPIVIISAMPNLHEIAAHCHVDDYLTKPFNISDFSKIIQKHLKD